MLGGAQPFLVRQADGGASGSGAGPIAMTCAGLIHQSPTWRKNAASGEFRIASACSAVIGIPFFWPVGAARYAM